LNECTIEIFDKYDNIISIDKPDEPIHLQVKYDHGIITPLITPALPLQRNTKAALHDAVED
jgi:hypothetical protein